eukprot:1355416-Prymnesium_polylepis.2
MHWLPALVSHLLATYTTLLWLPARESLAAAPASGSGSSAGGGGGSGSGAGGSGSSAGGGGGSGSGAGGSSSAAGGVAGCAEGGGGGGGNGAGGGAMAPASGVRHGTEANALLRSATPFELLAADAKLKPLLCAASIAGVAPPKHRGGMHQTRSAEAPPARCA